MNDASQWYPALEEKLGGMARELKASLRPWAAGGAVAFFTTNWGISAINGMLTSAIIYIVLKKLFPKA